MLEHSVYKVASINNRISNHGTHRSDFGFPVVKETGGSQGWFVSSDTVRQAIKNLQETIGQGEAGDALEAALNDIIRHETFLRGIK